MNLKGREKKVTGQEGTGEKKYLDLFCGLVLIHLIFFSCL